MPIIAEESFMGYGGYGAGHSNYGQVLEITDSPTLREVGGYGQAEVIGTVDVPIVGTVDPASWGQYIPWTKKKRKKLKEKRREMALKQIAKKEAQLEAAYRKLDINPRNVRVKRAAQRLERQIASLEAALGM